MLQTPRRIPVTAGGFIRSFSEPRGKVYLLYGDPLVFRLSLTMAAKALSKGTPIAVVDGCNKFDVHAITRFAREHRLNPDILHKKIFVSRGFTCYQMEAAITTKLLPFLQRIRSTVALVFGLLDTFYDEQAPLREAQQGIGRVLAAFQVMKQNGISLLLTCTEWNVLPQERNQLLRRLIMAMDGVYHLTVQAERFELSIEQPSITRKESLSHGTHSTNLYQHYRQ